MKPETPRDTPAPPTPGSTPRPMPMKVNPDGSPGLVLIQHRVVMDAHGMLQAVQPVVIACENQSDEEALRAFRQLRERTPTLDARPSGD